MVEISFASPRYGTSNMRRAFRATIVMPLGLAALAGINCRRAVAEDRAVSQDDADRIRPLLAEYCIDCQGEETHEKDLRIDQLQPQFDGALSARWRLILERVELGQKPPAGAPRPTADEVRTLSTWIRSGLRSAELARRAKEGRVASSLAGRPFSSFPKD